MKKQLLLVVFLGLVFLMNIYKFEIMQACHRDGSAYPIFPWSSKAIPSRSTPLWLTVHLLTALALLTINTLILVVKETWIRSSWVRYLHLCLYYVFMLVILCNVDRLGDNSIPIATLINCTLLILSCVGYWKQSWMLHHIAVSAPVALEMFLRLFG